MPAKNWKYADERNVSRKRSWGCLGGTLLIGLGLLILIGIASSISTWSPDVEPRSTTTVQHSTTFDFTRDKQIQSENMVRMSGNLFPSYLNVYADLSMSQVSLEITKDGMIVCGDADRLVDDIVISFDGERELFTCHESQTARDSLTVGPVYLDDSGRFIEKAQHAKHMTIQPLVMGKGRVEFEFSAH